ncbi:uncharacterized protein LOC128502300 [Spea bombifrons]|uniref:uncharacterized protein LOC128502300 n=1 Tax=Spea bombifrons TaxID=233779 RepID=UPI0023493FBA|nr:uncharacterized protein LOC128502300 [Spea bombifrons]
MVLECVHSHFCFAAILILLFPLSILGVLILCVFHKIRAAPLVVGIFSRSSEEDYKWLTQELWSENFKGSVKEIRPVCIFNNGARQFRAEVEKCDFAILYHTKNRGRLNITNVEDAIYNYELNYLSDTLGRGKVIVVVDDLDNSGEEEKLRILRGQPDIRDRAQDLFLFTTADKRNPHLRERKLHEMKRVMSSGSISTMNLCDDLNICGRSSSFQYERLTF